MLREALTHRALFCLHARHPIRQAALNTVTATWFHRLVTGIVFLNCVCLAIRQPAEDDGALLNTISLEAEIVFTILFTIECMLMVTAYGFVMHSGSYLRGGWNVVDFLIVALSWLSLVPGSGSMLSLRTVRLLKPLRTISTNPSMRTLVTALVTCIPMLFNVLLLWMLVFVLFGVIGMQLWSGLFHQYCTHTPTGSRVLDDMTGEPRLCGGDRTCPSGFVCSNTNPFSGNYWQNPHFGVTSFDNFGWTLVTIFQVMTMEGWTDINYMTWDVFSTFSVVYWLFLILFCSYFIVSLATAVVYSNFSKAEDEDKMDEEVQRQIERLNSCERDSVTVHLGIREGLQKVERVRRFSIQRPALPQSSLAPWEAPGAGRGQEDEEEEEDDDDGVIHNNTAEGRDQAELQEDDEEEWESPTHTNLNQLEQAQQALQDDQLNELVPYGKNPGGETPLSEEISALSIGMSVGVPTSVMGEGIAYTPNTPQRGNSPVPFHLHNEPMTTTSGPVTESYEKYAPKEDTDDPPLYSFNTKLSGVRKVSGEEEEKEGKLLQVVRRVGSPDGGEANGGDIPRTPSQAWSPNRASTPRLEDQDMRPWLLRQAYAVVTHDYFTLLIMGAILLNTVCLSLEHHNMPSSLASFLEVANLVFLVIFTLEMCLKLLGLGPSDYFADSFNTFDACIVLISIAEVFVIPSGSGPAGLSALRTFRLLRIVKLVRRLESIQRVVRVVVASLPSIACFCCVLFIIAFTLALLGMEIFGNQMYEFEGCSRESGVELDSSDDVVESDVLVDVIERGMTLVSPNSTKELDACFDAGGEWKRSLSRSNFKNIFWAFLTVFQLISAENWHLVMFIAVKNTSWHAVWYFIAVLLIGHYVLLNLFLAAIMKNMEALAAEDIEAQQMQHLESLRQHSLTAAKPNPTPLQPLPSPQGLYAEASEESLESDLVASSTDQLPKVDENTEYVEGGAQMSASGTSSFLAACLPLVVVEAWTKFSNRLGRSNHSLWIISPESKFRILCNWIRTHPYFENLVIMAIILSCLLLAVENPHREGQGPFGRVPKYADMVFTLFFALEMMIKVVAMSFMGYAKDPWNRLDGVIALSSTFSLVSDGSIALIKSLRGLRVVRGTRSFRLLRAMRGFKMVKALRVLRPLRLLSHNLELQLVVSALIKSLPAVGNISCFLLLEWYICAILGVQLFGGSFYMCGGPDTVMTLEGVALCEPHHTSSNFDNVWEGLLTIFELSTMEDWPAYMYQAIDAKPDGEDPERDANPHYAIFFVLFVIVGAMFTLNLMVSAIVNHYLAVKEQNEGRGVTLTEEQYRWVQTMRLLLRVPPEKRPTPPKTPAKFPWIRRQRRRAFHLVTHIGFDILISLCIFFSVLVMVTSHQDESSTYQEITQVINFILSGIFLLEAALKLLALGIQGYFKDRWNIFDFCIVLTSIFSFILFMLGTSIVNVSILRAFRVVRSLRTLRMLRGAKGVRMLLQAFIFSLPSLYNVGSLLFMIFFMYAVLGMTIFGDMELTGQLHKRANFSTFGQAMFMLFRCCTGENWASIFHQCRDHTIFAVAYFVSFLILTSWLMVNLFIAVILDNFDEAQSMEDALLTRTDIAIFADEWARYDPKAENMIRTECLPQFLRELGRKSMLGFRTLESSNVWVFQDHVKTLDIPDRDGFVHYYEVLQALSYRLIGQDLPESQSKAIDKLVNKKFPRLKKFPASKAMFYESLAAHHIQKVWKGHAVRKRALKQQVRRVRQRVSVVNALHVPFPHKESTEEDPTLLAQQHQERNPSTLPSNLFHHMNSFTQDRFDWSKKSATGKPHSNVERIQPSEKIGVSREFDKSLPTQDLTNSSVQNSTSGRRACVRPLVPLLPLEEQLTSMLDPVANGVLSPPIYATDESPNIVPPPGIISTSPRIDSFFKQPDIGSRVSNHSSTYQT